MYCSKCGKELQDDAKFCSNCGHRMIEETAIPSNVNTSTKTLTKKTAVFATISVLLCLTIIGIVVFRKSPKELLIDNEWYSEISAYSNDYYDYYEYYYTAECEKIVFYSDGEAEITEYELRGTSDYEVNSENVPISNNWNEYVDDDTETWEVMENDSLKYDDDYYSWDDKRQTKCDCEEEEIEDGTCKHKRTWYITNKELRIGRKTFTSKKPSELGVND